MYRQLLLVVFLAAGLVLAGPGLPASPGDVRAAEPAAAAKPKEVTMKDNAFEPKELKIKVGDSVIWVNKGKDTHDVIPDKKDDFEKTGDVKPGKMSKPITFKKAGKFPYVCGYHEDEMKGVIIVEEK